MMRFGRMQQKRMAFVHEYVNEAMCTFTFTKNFIPVLGLILII